MGKFILLYLLFSVVISIGFKGLHLEASGCDNDPPAFMNINQLTEIIFLTV